jgi:hypothetical protein
MHRTMLLLLCAGLGLSGCAKRADYEAAAPSPDYAAGSTADMAPAMPADYESVKRDEAHGGDGKAMPEEPMMTTPTTMPAAPARTPPSGGATDKLGPPKQKPAEASEGKEREPSKEPEKVARQIIYTAEMGISVFKLDEAMERAEALALESGGYVQSMSQGYYVLRIPAAKLRGVMAELGKLGVVESRSLQAQDVTEEFVDLTTRIRVLKETQQQLITLLKSARNVEEALNVRRSLDQITMELEQAMGRLRMLESLIGFSTLTVRMSQRGPQNAIPSSNDPFPWVDGLGVEATEWN